MPIYEFNCEKHGWFEVLRVIGSPMYENCPQCAAQCVRVVSAPAPAVFKEYERLPLGNGARGKYLSSEETGGLPVYVPSFGAMEQEEIDYVAEAAVDRSEKREPRESKVALQSIVNETMKAPKGKRRETIEKITRERIA